MGKPAEILAIVRQAAKKRILFLPHAVRQMATPDRLISVDEVRYVIENGEMIEDYPEDERGHSCLVLGKEKMLARFMSYVLQRKII